MERVERSSEIDRILLDRDDSIDNSSESEDSDNLNTPCRHDIGGAVGGARVTQRGVSQRYLSYAQSGSLVCGRSGAARNKTRVYTKTC
ncbi:hypothetical protein J6590_077798 [Homalodisca vitripennis]|nr:hypothetical protein J6590_077798 [Homalodisca vitripennis]